MNFEHEKSGDCKGKFSSFCKLMSFTAAKKTGLIDFSEKRTPTKGKHLLPACHVLGNFTEGNMRKFNSLFSPIP